MQSKKSRFGGDERPKRHCTPCRGIFLKGRREMKALNKRTAFPGWSLWMAGLTGFRYRKESDDDRGSAERNQPGSHQPQLVPPPVQPCTFSGTVVRSGQRFALLNSDDVLYPLDSTGRAWSFEGEDVRVTGSIDTVTQLIHIIAIESEVA